MLHFKSFLSTLALIAPMSLSAQMVSLPMTPSNGSLKETVSGRTLAVNTALTPYNVAGAKGDAWRLDGYSSYANGLINLSSLNGKKQLTFSLWVAPESYPLMRLDENGEWFTTMVGSMRINDNNQPDNTNGKGFAFQLGSRGFYQFTCFSNGFQLNIKASEKLKRYQWNHLVAVIDGQTKRATLYNNGVEMGSVKCGNSFTSTANELFVGKSYVLLKDDMCHLNTFNGLIDDFDVYEGVRTDVVNETCNDTPNLFYSASRYAGDICRPAFHGMPSGNWTNESHGAVYYNGQYHVFFQKNPNGLQLTHMHWGHIVSDNLYDWKEMPTAISPGDDVTWYDQKGCWSGCVFTDDVLTGGKPNIFYTGVDYGRAMISQAVPADDELRSWNKVANNPIINGCPSGMGGDFRDCFVFKNNDNYYMIVGCTQNGVGCATLHVYDKGSRTWSNDGKLFFQGQMAGRDGNYWEMPNVTRLGNKWMFTCTPLSTDKGTRTLYWIGSINADGTFSPDNVAPKTLELDGFSRDGYGLLSPTIFEHDGKTLMLGVVPDKLGMNYTYNLGYAHAFSLPREISLSSNGTLLQKPYSGLVGMRSSTAVTRDAFTLNGEEDLSPVEGRALELRAEFTVGKSAVGFTVLGNGNRKVRITYSPSANTIDLDLSNIDRIVQDGTFGGVYTAQLPKKLNEGQTAKLTVYVDHSFIDLFVNDSYAASVRVFPTDVNGVKATMFSDGPVNMRMLKAYVLNPNISASITSAEAPVAWNVEGGLQAINYDTAGSTAHIQVYDTAGRCLKTLKAVNGKGQVDINTRGLNIVRLTDTATGHVQVFKVVVK